MVSDGPVTHVTDGFVHDRIAAGRPPMSTDTRPADPAGSAEPPSRRPLPIGAKLLAGILLAIPLVALALVPTYSRATPVVWGFPFFYWYQLLWVLLTPLFTWSAYVVIVRARGERR